MMDRITPNLLRTYRSKVVSPVIVEARTDMFDRVRATLKENVPVTLLQATFHTFLPRIMRLIEFPLAKWKEIKAFNMLATVLTPNLIEEVAQWREVERVYPDYIKWALITIPSEGIFKDAKNKEFTSTYWTKKMLGVDAANRKGFTGIDVNVAVVDTGARVTHQQLGRVRVLSAMTEKGGSGQDSNGHGSWCTATVGGSYAIDRRYNIPVEGMAPNSNLFSIQALGFIIGTGTTSDVLQALEMAENVDARVVSLSLGSDDSVKDEDNPEAKAVNRLVEKGIIPCIAAGNSGPDSETVGTPGSCRSALTVGSISPFTGEVNDFSSRGPTADGEVKPDVVAPGERINSALVGFLDAMTDRSQLKFGAISGTSMATPHISGLVACICQLYREKLGKELTVEEVKTMMSSLGHEKNNADGWGPLTWKLVEDWMSIKYGVTLS